MESLPDGSPDRRPELLPTSRPELALMLPIGPKRKPSLKPWTVICTLAGLDAAISWPPATEPQNTVVANPGPDRNGRVNTA